MLALPTNTAPSARSFAITVASKGGTKFSRIFDAQVVLTPLVAGRDAAEPVFLSRSRRPFTRFGILVLVKRYAAQVARQMPSLARKKVGAHTIRHTTAVHLLRAGVDINTIRAWLGHVSLNTTNIYAEIDLELKAQALAHCEPPGPKPRKRWREEPGVLDFLRTL